MRVTIERGTFLKSLNHVQSVVERRNTIPILSNVLLQASDGALKLTATDLDIEIIEQTAADIGQPGSTTVPAHMLYDIVRKLPDGAQLQLEQGPDEGRLAVIAGRSRFRCRRCRRRTSPILPAESRPTRSPWLPPT
jgi:DNA polymerase-3 subunit beta